jgi:hypothetical protein
MPIGCTLVEGGDKRWSGRRGLSSRVPIIGSSSFTASATEWNFASPWEPELAFRPCHHPVLDVGDAGRLDGADLLELHLRVPVELGSLFA